MLVELFFETLYGWKDILLTVSSFRHSRKNNCKTKPIPINVFTINREDFYKLVSILDHICILWTENDYDFNSWNLYLKIINNKQGNIEKWNFISSL